MITSKLCLCIAAIGMLPPAVLSAQTPDTAHHWGYSGANGPAHWSELDPANAACSTGRTESPINIPGATAQALKPLVFDYHPGLWQVVDNGHTVQVNVASGSYLVVDGHKYALIQFHFHHPSEDEIAGKHFDMEMHLVHQDADGHLAVVAVLLAEGKANPLIQMVWDHVPPQKDEPKALTAMLDPKQLLPTTEGYYSFAGSLTTPPCTEGVRWFVMKSALKISPEEERSFATLYPDNARPIQPLNGRKIQVLR